MKSIFSFVSLRTAFRKGIRKGSKPWKVWFFIVIVFRVIKWLFAKPAPTKVDEYELSPGEYKIIVQEKSRGQS